MPAVLIESIYIIMLVLGAIGAFMLLRKWIRQEPKNLREEKLQQALDYREQITKLAQEIREKTKSDDVQAPADVQAFIDMWCK